MDTYNLERFKEKQKQYYPLAYGEIYHGQKQSHWMWWIFPQIKGLGISPTAQRYAIQSMDEAKAYLSDSVLRKNLIEISKLLIDNPLNDSSDIRTFFDYPDDLKLHSSMTLFHLADPEEEVFVNVLNKFFDGKEDDLTIRLLENV